MPYLTEDVFAMINCGFECDFSLTISMKNRVTNAINGDRIGEFFDDCLTCLQYMLSRKSIYLKQLMFKGCESCQCGWRDDNLEDLKEEDVAEVVVETAVRVLQPSEGPWVRPLGTNYR